MVNNLISTESDGATPLGNSSNGIAFSTSGNTIVGTTPGTGNTIAFQTNRKVSQGQEITATATWDATGDTSEFSNSFGV